MRTRLLAVQGPLQFITGYIAFDWYHRLHHVDQDSETVLLLYDFLAAPGIETEIAESILQLSRVSRWTRTVLIRSSDMAAICRGRFAKRIERLHAALGYVHFDEIVLARDHVGEGSPLLINAYPSATRVTYGDSFGVVGQRASLGATPSPRSMRSRLSGARRHVLGILFGRARVLPFDVAVLSLPLDVSGEYLSTLPLVVPPRRHVVACIDAMNGLLTTLASYSTRVLAQSVGADDHLFLLSNLSASGLTTREAEVELYVEVIRQMARPGSTVFVKHHPRSSRETVEAVVGRLHDAYRVVVLDDETLSRIPIELWSDLIRHCCVVAMFSTSAINLKYIYDKRVELPLDPARIERYFLPEKVAYAKFVDDLIRQSIANLELWDGRSPLWTKCHENS